MGMNYPLQGTLYQDPYFSLENEISEVMQVSFELRFLQISHASNLFSLDSSGSLLSLSSTTYGWSESIWTHVSTLHKLSFHKIIQKNLPQLHLN